MELVLNLSFVNRLMAVPNTWSTEPVVTFMEEFNYLKLIYKLLARMKAIIYRVHMWHLISSIQLV